MTNGKLNYVLNTSTGGSFTYTDDGVTALAHTPVGHFHVYRQVDAMVVDSHAELWRPKFLRQRLRCPRRLVRTAVPSLLWLCEGERRGDRLDLGEQPLTDRDGRLGVLATTMSEALFDCSVSTGAG